MHCHCNTMKVLLLVLQYLLKFVLVLVLALIFTVGPIVNNPEEDLG